MVEAKMAGVVEAMERDFRRVRAGRASAALVDGLMVDHRGRRQPLAMIASISVPDPRLIVIEPWDRSAIRSIGSAIGRSGIGIAPAIDGSTIRLTIPPLSEERRGELAGQIRARVERARVEIRAARHAALAELRAAGVATGRSVDEVHRDTDRLDRLTERFVADLDRRAAEKTASLLDLG